MVEVLKKLVKAIGIIILIALMDAVIMPVYMLCITAWFWLSIVFAECNCFGGAGLGFAIGLVLLIAVEVLRHKFLGED